MESPLSLIESRVDANQRMMSFSTATGSALLAFQHIAEGAHWNSWFSIPITVATVASWLLFLVTLRQNQKIFLSEEGQAFKTQLLGDERLQDIQREAFTWGFGGMLLMQVVFILVYSLFEPHFLSIPVAATSTMAAGICTAVLRYQTLWSR